MNGGDVRMLEAGLKLYFAPESLGLIARSGVVLEKDLHRLDPAGNRVLDFEHPAHATSTKQ